MKYMAHIFVKDNDEEGDVVDDEFLFGNSKLKLAEVVEKCINDKEEGKHRELVGIFLLTLEDGENELPQDTGNDDVE